MYRYSILLYNHRDRGRTPSVPAYSSTKITPGLYFFSLTLQKALMLTACHPWLLFSFLNWKIINVDSIPPLAYIKFIWIWKRMNVDSVSTLAYIKFLDLASFHSLLILYIVFLSWTEMNVDSMPLLAYMYINIPLDLEKNECWMLNVAYIQF